jgi:riboflavin biosynthesis pyrimidine reductase
VLTKTKPVSEQTNVKWIDINGLSLEEVFKALYRDFKITSILVEGGPTLLTSIIDQNLFDLMTVYINPILLGNGHALYKNEDNHMIKDALSFGETRWSVLNNQAVLEIHNVHRSH